MTTLFIVFIVCIAVRFAFIAFHWNHFDTLWNDFDRRGLSFQIAWFLSVVTLIAYFAAVIVVFWKLPKESESWLMRYATIVVGWLGIGLLERFPLHKFPRLHSPSLFREAQIDLYVNLIMAFGSAIGMTLLFGVYYWWRG